MLYGIRMHASIRITVSWSDAAGKTELQVFKEYCSLTDDFNRVVISGENDYINASHVQVTQSSNDTTAAYCRPFG